MSFLAQRRGVRDLIAAAVDSAFARINRLPATIEWLSDNAGCYIAGATRSFRPRHRPEPRTTRRPQSNRMTEAFVRTIKRDYVRVTMRKI
jgi:putative transposase